MNEVNEYILKTYNQLSENENLPIDDFIVDEAIAVVNNLTETDSKSLFYLLSAINLLNAAIKVKKYKSQLHYEFIKTKVSNIADNILNNPSHFDKTSVFYDINQKCIYLNVYNVVFSFHHIQETKLIKTIASKNEPIIWTGIRLQRIAQCIFIYAKEVYERFNNKINLSMQKNLIDNMESHLQLNTNNDLYSCPNCQHLISHSAINCPNCGGIIVENTIIKDYNVGDIVQITYNIHKVLGEIILITPHFISIHRNNDANGEMKIRINAIDSIQSFNKSNNIETYDFEKVTNNIFSPQKLANALDNVVAKMFSILSIENETIIPTNATITEINETYILALSDNGETTQLSKHMINYKKRNWSIGARLYINSISGLECPFSIMETTFHNLLSLLRKTILYRKGLTSKRRKTILSILKFMMEEMTSKKEAYIEFNPFYKAMIQYIGKTSNLEEDDKVDNNIDNTQEVKNTNNNTSTILFKTETEELLSTSGLSQPKILGKIDLDTIYNKKKNNNKTISTENNGLKKPSILSAKVTLNFLNKKLANLTETRCKSLEKELDSLIRNGKKEECLTRSYQIINTHRPTPKYFKSYLDRIVNTEIALDHTELALQALAYLIAFMEQQGETNANSMGHLYVTMARLYLKEKNKEEALKAVQYAESLTPFNKTITKLKDSISQLELNEDNSNTPNLEQNKKNTSNNVNEAISKMLFQDIEQEAHRLELLPSSEIVAAEQLFGRAQNNRDNNSETYEDRASLFLEAAAAYYKNKQVDTIMFKISVANYARLRGHGMFARFSNHLMTDAYSLDELHAFRDSACSYYIEALGIFNSLGEKKYLQELFLKYLQLAIVISNIEGGKTTSDDWERWSLHQLQLDCIKADSLEEKKVLFNTCISVGTAAEGAWNTLYQDKDGLYPFISRFGSLKFREESYSLFNELAESSISLDFQPGVFMHKIFEHRQVSINELKDKLKDCLKWTFCTFDILTFETEWNKVVEYKQLMTTTDIKITSSIKEVIDILKPYAGRKENERTRLLVRSQQILLGLQKIVTDTATFYGRTYFSYLVSEWLTEISRLLEERDASTYPKLEITPEPCFIRNNEKGLGTIDFVVTNNGDSTAQSFYVVLTIDGKKYKINHDKELPAGDCCGESLSSEDLLNMKYCNVVFELTTKYQGKELPVIITEATYEVESSDILTDEIKIPWTTSSTPEKHIFKGREGVLNVLVEHYLSKDRSLTYILYGLTRTGKSSILEYLRCRINGLSLKENPNYMIISFKWNLNEFPYKNSTSSQFWTWALETNIYNELNDELADKVDMSYGENGLPPAELLSQLDFTKIVDVLNNNNIIPLITIDEFSFVRHMLKEGLIDATFIATLRNLALTGKACFVYAGIYEIKDLTKEKEFGLEGQMTNTRAMHINEIDPQYADELIDACELITFDDKAKTYIRALSGCVPYWIQWICLDCGKYAVSHKRRHLGYNDVNHVVEVLTGEIQPRKNGTCVAIDEANFHNNQIDPENIAEHQLISSISYLNRESTQIRRGISMDELKRLWDKYSVSDQIRVDMTKALISLKEKNILHSFTDEGREVYRLNVDLFRRWWFAHHKDISVELSKKI